MIIKVKTVKSSICDCGYPTLSKSIPIGTEYKIHTDDQCDCSYLCGGCNKKKNIIVVMTEDRFFDGKKAGYLPRDIFE